MGDELKSCPVPWCGNNQASVVPVFADRGIEGDHYQVICPICGCRGRLKLDRVEAIQAWNTRTETQSQATIDELVGALRELEAANEELAAQRSVRTYHSIVQDGAESLLIMLDNARAKARTLIAKAGGQS